METQKIILKHAFDNTTKEYSKIKDEIKRGQKIIDDRNIKGKVHVTFTDNEAIKKEIEELQNELRNLTILRKEIKRQTFIINRRIKTQGIETDAAKWF